MKSLISIFLQTDDAVDVTSRHILGRRIVSTSSTLRTRPRVMNNLPEINRLGKHQRFTILNFEITFFLKTDKLKSAFKLRLTSPGRKLLPILVYCILKSNKLFKLLFKLLFKDNKILNS